MNPAASPTKAFHVWFSTKGRKAVLVEEIRLAVLSLLESNAAGAGVDLLEMEAIEDHMHLLVLLGESHSLPRVMHQLKGASAREIFRAYPELRLYMETSSLWQKSYGARLVLPDQIAAVRHYIRTQADRPLRHE